LQSQSNCYEGQQVQITIVGTQVNTTGHKQQRGLARA